MRGHKIEWNGNEITEPFINNYTLRATRSSAAGHANWELDYMMTVRRCRRRRRFAGTFKGF